MANLYLPVILLCLFCGSIATQAEDVAVSPTGPAEIVFRYKRDACDARDIPDAPARAFRDASGRVHLYAPHDVNRGLTGPSLDAVRPDCRIAYRGGEKDDPAAFDDRAWLAAFATEDGRTVHALVHNEFHGHKRRALCPSGKYMECWANAITAAISTDDGATFRRVGGPVAALPYRYRGDLGRHAGFFNPSNIVRKDGFLYSLVFAVRQEAQKGGACLMRTRHPEDPSSWRAWDGKDFTVRFLDPYREADDPARHVCVPVGKGSLGAPVSSVVRHQPSGLFIATMAAVRPEGMGVFVATSPDLVTWSPARLTIPMTVSGKQSCDEPAAWNYPSLLDPRSPSRTFETVGDTAYLYLTRFNLADCKLGMDRDLVRLPVRIDVETRNPASLRYLRK